MNSIPTKLYEYVGFHLPILLVNHKPWVEFCHAYDAALVFDANHYDASALYNEMMTRKFYPVDPVEVYWASEAPKLLAILTKLKRVRKPKGQPVRVLE